MARFAVAETIDGEHVVALREIGQHAGVVLPLHALAVHEHERRPVVGTFGVVDDGLDHRAGCLARKEEAWAQPGRGGSA